ncbi:MAG: N-acetylmuramoyl-L-alanine amidase [Desulfobacterales bacterium]|nr:N-acetylmuramoyl-L-alanine amidase [Desulfobacterales bacterium]
MMFSKRKSNSNPKEAILRGVYIANLKVSGKRVEDDRALKQPSLHRRRSLFAVLLAAAFCFFPGPGSSLPENEKSPMMAMVLPPIEPDDSFSYSGPETPWPLPLFDLVQASTENALSGIPDQDLTEFGDPNLVGYTLLVSQDDPVRLTSLFGLGIRNIVIDPGHGGIDPGAVGAMGTKEKEITLDVALQLKNRLSRIGAYNVLLTRDSDRTMSLAKRVQFAKDNRADLFISLHVNALPDQSVNVVETYYFGPPLSAETLRLAEQENKESHYAVQELSAIIQDFGNTVKRQESAMLAASIQESLCRNVKNHDAGVLDVGIKMAPFVVLSQVEAPSVLVEISCLTKEKEEAKLASEKYREEIASFLEEGVLGYLGKQQFNISRWER